MKALVQPRRSAAGRMLAHAKARRQAEAFRRQAIMQARDGAWLGRDHARCQAACAAVGAIEGKTLADLHVIAANVLGNLLAQLDPAARDVAAGAVRLMAEQTAAAIEARRAKDAGTA